MAASPGPWRKAHLSSPCSVGRRSRAPYASAAADIDTGQCCQVYGTAGDDVSVCRRHTAGDRHVMSFYFLRRTPIHVILIRIESNEV